MKKWLTGNNPIVRIVQIVCGIILISIGIPGLFLPIIQGILFITVGIILIGGKPAREKLKKWTKQISLWLKKKKILK